MTEGGDQVARARIKAHEDLCAERYKNLHGRIDNIHLRINDVADAMKWAASLLIVTLIGIAGWGLQQINQGQKEQLALLQKALVAAQPSPPPQQR